MCCKQTMYIVFELLTYVVVFLHFKHNPDIGMHTEMIIIRMDNTGMHTETI